MAFSLPDTSALPGPGARTRLRDMLRSHSCGVLRETDAGQAVTLAGSVHLRRGHGGQIFIDLRDSIGFVQIVIHPQRASEASHAALPSGLASSRSAADS